MNEDALRTRILTAFQRDLPDTARVMNAGALEDELWTDESWRDEYADDLIAELSAMTSDGLLEVREVWGDFGYLLTKAGVAQT